MGHKGVSKRKESQAKSKSPAAEKTNGSVSSAFAKTAESLPVKSVDSGKGSSDSKKKAKK